MMQLIRCGRRPIHQGMETRRVIEKTGVLSALAFQAERPIIQREPQRVFFRMFPTMSIHFFIPCISMETHAE